MSHVYLRYFLDISIVRILGLHAFLKLRNNDFHIFFHSVLETGKKFRICRNYPKLAIRKFFGLIEISFDHELSNCYLI